MKLSEYLKQNGMTSKEYFDMQKRRSNGKTTLTDYRKNQEISLKNKVGFDTIDDDLQALGTTVESIYKEWQPQETIINTKAAISSMQERLNAYNEYAKAYGGTDASDLASGYESVLADLDNLSTTYGQYKTADAFNSAVKNVQFEKQFRHEDGSGYTFEEVQAKLKKYTPGSDEHKYLSAYTNYSDLNDFNKAMESGAVLDIQKQIDSLKAEKEKLDSEYKANGGYIPSASNYNRPAYSQVDSYKAWQAKTTELENKIKELEDTGYYGELKKKKNLHALENKVDLYKPEYEAKDDFEEKSKYVTTYNENKKTNAWAGLPLKYEDLTYEYINNVDGAREKIQKADEAANKDGNGYMSEWQKKGYDLLREDEIAIYNYKYSEESKDSANKFLKDMQTVLDKRRTDALSKGWEQNAGEMPVLSNAASVILKPAGSIIGAVDDAINAGQGKDYNPYSYAHTISNFVSDTRKYTGENIAEKTEGLELFGQNVPSFLYNTGMSIADSVYGVASVGKFNSVLMGTGAFQEKAKEMVEAGADNEVVWKSAITSGVAETLFEHIGIDNLFKIKNVDSLSSLVKNTLKQAGAEAFEEIGTEITNIIADDVIRGKDSELYKMYSDLIARGYSESEARSKTALQAGSQVAWAGIGGALSGGVMGSVAGAKNYGENKSTGAEIRGNERVTDMLNIAAMSPQESDAYKAYTQYAKRGMTADNVTDAQLGNLYGMVENDARSTVMSKKTTDEQKADAETAYNRLAKMKTENNAAKTANELSKTDEEGTVTPATRDEVIKELADGMKNESEAKAELFRLVDDGKANAMDYADSFNLVYELAQKKVDPHYILKRRGVLSAGQVDSIHKAVIVNPKLAQQKRIGDMVKKHTGNLEVKGTIDDSVIDYDNTGAEGKVNWKDIHPDARANITILATIAATRYGSDVKLVKNGRDYGFTGYYDRQGNTIYIDVTARTEDILGADTDGRKDNSRFIASTISHELTHFGEEKAPERYAEYDKMIMDALTSNGLTVGDILGYRRKKMEEAEAKRAKKENRKPREFTDDDVRREVIARASEDMIVRNANGEELFKSLTESEQKQFVDRVKEVIQNIKQWIKDVLSKLKSDAPEAALLRETAKDLDAIAKKWDEMLREAAIVNAAMKKDGINDETIMESKTGDTQNADIDTNVAEQYNNWESYELTDEFVKKVPPKERHAFLRSLANQTNELKQGEHKNIIIFTDKHVYFYAATGYMNGSIEDTLKAGSKKANAEIKAWRDISGSSDTSTTTPDSMAQSYGSKRRRDGWDNDANGYIEEKGRADDVDEQAHESDAIGYNWESDGDFQEDEELIPGSYVYMDDGRAFKVSDNGTIEDIQFSDIDEDTQTTINQTMTMQQAKDMIQRAFVLNNIKAWYDDQYKNGDEWLAGEGATEVAAYIENTYEVYEKYIGSKYQGIVDGDWFVEDIVDAYVNKTLTGKAKVKTQWMDLNQNVAVADKRFYSPKEIKNAKQKLEIAKQRLTNSNKAAVTKARAEILLYAHNKGAAETLGLTEGELKKMLRQWGGYSASAREISMRFNNNVAVSNRWVGIENCSWLKSAQVSEKELARLVNSIEGDSRGFERNYIARTMLALDTHIDWSEIKFVFTGVVDPNRRSVRGLYNNETRTVTASYGSQNTVAHEMGHALDYKWARDLGFRENDYLTNRYLHASQLKTEEQKLWFAHFRDFVSSLTDKADLTSEYTMRDQEVFARFVASFVEWVDKTATGRASYGYMGFKDKFTGSDYVSFVKILQEKAMLDSKAMSAETDVQYSDIDEDVGNMSARDLYYNIARVSLDIDALERDIRLNPHGDNKLRESKLLDAKEKYVKYGEFLLANRENFALEKLYHLGHALKITNSYEMPKDYSLEQFKKDLGERVDEYKKSLDSAFESGMSRDDKKLYTFLKMMTYRYGEHINGSTEENVVTAEDDWLLDASEDMVFSDIDPEVDIYELLGENKRLAKENKILRADFERLMERRKLEGKLTHGKQLNKNQLDIVAGHIRNLGNSTYSKEKLVEKLNEVYTHIATSDELAWDDLFARFYGIAEDVLDEAKPVHSPNEYYANIYKELRNMEISLSDEQKQYVKSMLGVDASKAFFGKIKITDKGMPLNSKWEELAGKYPNEFATDNDKDQVIALLEIYETAKELKEVVEEYDKVEQTRWLANEIYNQYWNVSPIRTVADKYDKQIKRLKFEHRTAMKELRDSYNERLEKQKKADREERSRIFKKLREDHIKELQEIRKSGKERMDKYKEEAARKTRIQSVTADCLTLNEWLVKNSKDKHIHESMKGPVIALLNAIDFSSKRALGMWGGDMKGVPTKQDISLQKALSQVKDMMAEASVGKADLVLLYGHELDADIAKMIESVDNIMRTVGDNEFILNKMTLDDLITLDNVVKTIKHAVTNMNKFHAVHHAKGIADSAQEEIAYAEKLGDEKVYDEQSMKSAFKKLIKWTNATPYYAFKRLGAAGQKIFEAIQDGWDKLAFNVKQIIDFTQKAYKSEEVRAWEKELHEFEVLVPATDREKESADYKPKYQKVQMTTAQVMNLYLLNKREAAKRHLLGGGIKVKDITIKKGKPKIKGKKVNFTQDQIEKIVGTLTPRQIEVADALSHFMNTVASDWGNEVSMARFGVKMFGEKAYVPMQVDKSNINTPDPNDQNNSLFKLLNMSFTKGLTEGANNRLVVGSIFDVFAQHASDMAKYNALALPVLDAFRWYNYTEKTPVGEEGHDQKSVKDAIENAFGKDGLKYITTFLEDINGARQSNRDPLMVKFFKTSKLASVGFNLRVVLLQPTSYFRASAVINQKYLASALFHTPKTQKRGMERAEKYCGMALWKSLGYFDTNIQKGMTEQIKHDKGTYDKWVELSMKLAGKMDRVTLGVLWNAAEQELKSTRKDLVFGNEEFFVEVGKRLREIIYATQVVDSTVTRSEMMRSPDTGNKILTTFMSEPTLAYNMLADSVIQTTLDARELGSKKAAIKKNGRKIARVLGAYIITNAVAALVESGFDAFRDDDDEEMDLAEFMKAYLSNFATDMSVVGKLPYLKDGLSIAQGYSPSRSDLQWMQSAYYTAKGIAKHLEGEGNPVTTIKNGLKTISYLSGLGLYNAYRDFMATLHTLDILTAEELEEILGEFVE